MGRLACGALCLVLPTLAWAQLRDPVPVDQIPNGGSVGIAASALGETAPDRSDVIAGELALLATWTRAGIDRTEGFRGPRWTKRWGAALSVRGAANTSGAAEAHELEQRGELALYVGSVGQIVRWQSASRLVDRMWQPARRELEVGAFVDFGGLGLVKYDAATDSDMSAEAFPMYFEITRGATTTTSFDVAVARVANERGDLRIIDERIVIRDDGERRAIAFDAALFSVRSLEISNHSPWRVSGALGISGLTPFKRESSFEGTNSVIPLVRVGIEHRATSHALRAARSEIGRPLLDGTDFGVELATMHRLVETGLDAGGQLTAWGRREVSDGVVLHGEGMLGIGRRQLAIAGDSVMRGSGLVVLVRGEVGVAVALGGGFELATRAWVEHSERVAMTRRWDAALLGGLAWRR